MFQSAKVLSSIWFSPKNIISVWRGVFDYALIQVLHGFLIALDELDELITVI